MFDLIRLHDIEIEWESIEQSFRLSPYNSPINRQAEYQHLLLCYKNGEIYNPQFKYASPPDFPVEQIRTFQLKLKPEKSLIESYYNSIVQRILFSIEAVKSHNANVISHLSEIEYGKPGRDLVEKAYSLLHKTPNQDESFEEKLPAITAEEFASKIQTSLNRFGYNGWKANIYEVINADVSVERLDKEIKIRNVATFTTRSLQRLIIHEIGVHVTRYENGAYQPIRLFRNGFPNYLETEEGLATYWEAQSGLLEDVVIRKYAARVLAGFLSTNHSFGEIFITLAPIIGEDLAFNTILRVKRGFEDTSVHGGYLKDIVYLRGFLKVKQHIEEFPNDQYYLLTGKVGLDDLPLVKSIESTLLVSPKHLPNHVLNWINGAIGYSDVC